MRKKIKLWNETQKCFNFYLGHQLTKVATPETWLYWPMKIKLATVPIKSQKTSIKAVLLVVAEWFMIHSSLQLSVVLYRLSVCYYFGEFLNFLFYRSFNFWTLRFNEKCHSLLTFLIFPFPVWRAIEFCFGCVGMSRNLLTSFFGLKTFVKSPCRKVANSSTPIALS